jgi:hypothetical protein
VYVLYKTDIIPLPKGVPSDLKKKTGLITAYLKLVGNIPEDVL